MKTSTSTQFRPRPLILVSLLLVAAALFAGGALTGILYTSKMQEIAMDVAPARARELINEGKFDLALTEALLAKASERKRGEYDQLLGEAYLGMGQPCIAAAHLKSSVEYFRENRLESLQGFREAKSLEQSARTKCAETRSG